MAENPYKYSGDAEDVPLAVGRPLWIYVGTFISGSTPLALCLLAASHSNASLSRFRGVPVESLALLAISATGLIMSFSITRRTWHRLNAIHDRITKTRRLRQEIAEEVRERKTPSPDRVGND